MEYCSTWNRHDLCSSSVSLQSRRPPIAEEISAESGQRHQKLTASLAGNAPSSSQASASSSQFSPAIAESPTQNLSHACPHSTGSRGGPADFQGTRFRRKKGQDEVANNPDPGRRRAPRGFCGCRAYTFAHGENPQHPAKGRNAAPCVGSRGGGDLFTVGPRAAASEAARGVAS